MSGRTFRRHAPARLPKEEPDRHVEHVKLDAVDQVLAVPIKDRPAAQITTLAAPWPSPRESSTEPSSLSMTASGFRARFGFGHG